MSTLDLTFQNGLKNYSDSRNFTFREKATGKLLTAAEFGHFYKGVAPYLYEDCMHAGLKALDNHPHYVLHITERDITNLKNEWLADPIWDIEDTPGFESVREKLKVFSDEQQMRWKQEAEEKQSIIRAHECTLHNEQGEEARALGLEGIYQLLLKQQQQITDLQNILQALVRAEDKEIAHSIMQFAIGNQRWVQESAGEFE